MKGTAPVLLAPNARWSVAVVRTSDERMLFQHQPHEVLQTASVGKILLLIEVARRVAEEELDPDEPLTRQPGDAVADSGLWQHLSVATLPVADLAALVGAVSDNLATNVLLNRVPLASIEDLAQELGLSRTRLNDKVRDIRTAADPPALSTGTASELARLFQQLDGGLVVSPAVSRHVLDWLAPGTDLSMVASSFGLDPLAHVEMDRGIVLRNKTGTNARVRADIGLVHGPQGAVAYAAIANGDMSTSGDPRDAVLRSMRDIGDLILAAVS